MMTFHFISTAVSPVTHMHGTAGNVALLQREAVLKDGSLNYVPCLSGNALRHALVRVPAADYMCETLGLSDMPYQLADLLYHGGRLTKATPLSASDTKDLIDYVPFFNLLGGAMPGQILQGCLKVSRALLMCRETADIIKMSSGVTVENPYGAESFVGTYQYTRSADENNPDSIADRMIYEGECVVAGAKFYHTMSLETESDLATGCLLKAIKDGSKYIGGMGRIGHGELDVKFSTDSKIDVDKLIRKYESFLKENADAIRDRLYSLFGCARAENKAEKATKKGKKKAGDNTLDFFEGVL